MSQIMKPRFKYELVLKHNGIRIEQYSNEYYMEAWLADLVMNDDNPIYSDDIKYISRYDINDAVLLEISDKDDELMKDLIRKTQNELEFCLKDYRERADLF